MTAPTLERDLVADCQRSAEAMNAFLAVVGQRNAKKAGSTLGFPDLVLMCAGQVHLIECKRPKADDHRAGELRLGQSAFIDKAAEHGVKVHAIWTLDEFVAIVNGCRRKRAVG